ncbi:MAG: prepilin-type N-terminal cleavage/methylation domain-containing protein [Candidatus Eremiobacteraeota bacterium]|nr:prepilin-type N-terminal cleavage/methylation domain-containing protein [Candidatus Eremiobacteraeota bacterium]MCW5868629.1 prepilin-type N-terminal cleavage/methylation domain-containing protein [Candidatus Eremiobacteraeota bacterium]
MRRRRRGHTIVELMIAGFLLGVVLTVSGRLAWLASRSKSTSEAQNSTFRQASIALERLQREALHTQEIYGPEAVRQPASPSLPIDITSANRLVLHSRSGSSPSGHAVIAYHRDPVKEELIRTTYEVAYNRLLPATQVVLDPPKVVATGVTSFQVYQIDVGERSTSENLSIRLVVRNKDARRAQGLPLATEVRLAR